MLFDENIFILFFNKALWISFTTKILMNSQISWKTTWVLVFWDAFAINLRDRLLLHPEWYAGRLLLTVDLITISIGNVTDSFPHKYDYGCSVHVLLEKIVSRITKIVE